MAGFEKELQVARALARQAGLAAFRQRGGGIDYVSKSDDSPVTTADRESERIISQGLAEAFPEDGLLGEEGAAKESRNGRTWIIDPIDGTRDFIRNNLTWSVLIGLEQAGEVVAGVAYLPALDRMYFASQSGGAFLNDKPIHISTVGTIRQAVLSIDGLTNGVHRDFTKHLAEWVAPFWAFRSMGGCLDALMVCSGEMEVWIETGGKPWDFAPLKIIAEQSGARFLNFDGGSSIYGGNGVIVVPALAEETMRFVKGSA